jgi:hypothetical protein
VLPADLLNPELGGLSHEERELVQTYREVPQILRGEYDRMREGHQQYRGATCVLS